MVIYRALVILQQMTTYYVENTKMLDALGPGHKTLSNLGPLKKFISVFVTFYNCEWQFVHLGFEDVMYEKTGS